MVKVGVNTWEKTSYNETIYTPTGRTILVRNIADRSVPSGETSYNIDNIVYRYCALSYNPNDSNHANGIQFLYFPVNVTGIADRINEIIAVGTGSNRSFGSNYGSGSNQWGLYADIDRDLALFYFKGQVSGFKSGQYRIDFLDFDSDYLGSIYIYLNGGGSSASISGFKALGETYVPNGYPLNPYIGKVIVGGNTLTATYINSRYVMKTDGKYVTDNQGNTRAVAEDSNGYWWWFSDTLNYSASSGYIENTYDPLTDTIYYRKYNGDTYTDTALASNHQYGETVTVPADSVAGTRTHYNFAGWYYRGNRVYAGQQVQTYPFYNLISPGWTPKEYTTTFVITQSDSVPASYDARTVPYGEYIILPTPSSPTATFQYWSDGTNHYNGGQAYYPSSNKTLSAVFQSKEFTVTFYDANGTQEGQPQTVIQDSSYSQKVNVPTAPSRPKFTFVGWAEYGTQSPIIVASNATKYAPARTIQLIRVYTYTLTLKDEHGDYPDTRIFSGNYTNGLTLQLPTRDSDNRPRMSGYRFIGWGTSDSEPSLTGTPPTPNYTNSVTITLTTSFNILYALFQPAELTSIAVTGLTSQNVKVGQTVPINANSVVISPQDYLGEIQWVKSPTNATNFNIVKNQNDNGATITGVSRTEGNTVHAVVRGLKKTWDSTQGYAYHQILVTVSDYIAITFWTRNALGELVIHDTAYVDDSDNDYAWVDDSFFDTPPTRTGFVFDGWTDAEGNVVSKTAIPHYPIDVYASWLPSYVPKDRDVLILQKFNNDGSQMTLSLDLGPIKSLDERFNLSLSPLPTPTKSSANTFITDLNVTETIGFSVTRKNPLRPSDLSDDPLNWSNGKWLGELRKLVDRWQSETDGIKALFIPRNLRSANIGGKAVYFGDNYDLLGYVKPRVEEGWTNAGLLYDENKVLVGYNCLITNYSDKYTAGVPEVVEATITLTLGGMVAGYEDLSKSLLGGE